ncbi:CYTH domain protein [Pirellulimonas nuda]|uniref:CYTH domain protein n=1 Tax=Pirellulimonas nuda TaxID=2528009 RepID=A0A518D8Q2_9BACT|nr:class IV adenylate cyclase [Pirellulimonas nuda]QDU87861.1 CYTH domain protein [Pirellulimonas nuda]
MLEVEVKYRLTDTGALVERLLTLGAQAKSPMAQSDLYFSHPARDFAQTDEALRVRSVGGESVATYKGAKIDTHTKTRREIETHLTDAPAFVQMLEALGFARVATVTKCRQPFLLAREGRTLEVSIDDVEGLGHFVEIEAMAQPADLQEARRCVTAAAESLGLEHGERRGYLEMLLQAQQPPTVG